MKFLFLFNIESQLFRVFECWEAEVRHCVSNLVKEHGSKALQYEMNFGYRRYISQIAGVVGIFGFSQSMFLGFV
jgi:hypothetical protein